MNDIIKKLAIESKNSEVYVIELTKEISTTLVREGCEESNPKFLQYLIRRLRKRLKIEESPVYKTFKQFFKEK